MCSSLVPVWVSSGPCAARLRKVKGAERLQHPSGPASLPRPRRLPPAERQRPVPALHRPALASGFLPRPSLRHRQPRRSRAVAMGRRASLTVSETRCSSRCACESPAPERACAGFSHHASTCSMRARAGDVEGQDGKGKGHLGGDSGATREAAASSGSPQWGAGSVAGLTLPEGGRRGRGAQTGPEGRRRGRGAQTGPRGAGGAEGCRQGRGVQAGREGRRRGGRGAGGAGSRGASAGTPPPGGSGTWRRWGRAAGRGPAAAQAGTARTCRPPTTCTAHLEVCFQVT